MHSNLRKRARLAATLLVWLAASPLAMTETDDAYATARDEIWDKEKAIYEARSNGDLSYYLKNAAAGYKGWPPYSELPGGLPYLSNMAADMVGLNQEELTMELVDFALAGDTAVIYYATHRTRMPNGDNVDQRYAICHVWTREAEGWKLIGAMGREKP